MDSNGGFHEVEKDGKLVLVYHHPKYSPIPQTQSPTSSSELSLQPRFLCPHIRLKVKKKSYSLTFLLSSSPECVLPTTANSRDHHVVPLFWCNNKEFDLDGGCGICKGSNSGTDYYFCNKCRDTFHKECVQSPLKIKHPYHPQHSLQLFFHRNVYSARDVECLCCRRSARWLVYYCTICQIFIHPVCAMKPIPFVVDRPKNHNHPLSFFPRQTCLTCNVCGLLRISNPTYVCVRCNFVAHNDCMYFPRIMKISRHHHRISYIPSFPSREWFCGVCRQSVNGDYGAYTCKKCNDYVVHPICGDYGAYTCKECNDYVVHPICATEKDVWNGKELEGVLEEDDITQDDGPFKMISEGLIRHFLHDHHLRLEVSIVYDEKKLCQACILPIFEGNFYSCMECKFILHEKCANAPRIIQHALHPHPLTLKYEDWFKCKVCPRRCSGFVYKCSRERCYVSLHVMCASISEPFDYKGHEHPLFLALDPEVTPICHVCERKCTKQLYCIKCNFIVCFKCATLPYKAKYKHDTHFLTSSCGGEEVLEKDWCEVCERTLKDPFTKVFYRCNECYTTFHIHCLFRW